VAITKAEIATELHALRQDITDAQAGLEQLEDDNSPNPHPLNRTFELLRDRVTAIINRI